METTCIHVSTGGLLLMLMQAPSDTVTTLSATYQSVRPYCLVWVPITYPRDSSRGRATEWPAHWTLSGHAPWE